MKNCKMNANSTVLTGLTGLSQEELVEAYENLSVNYLQVKKLSESIQQEAYELRRNLKTATAAESFLSQELEITISSQSKAIEKIRQKHNEDFDEFKKKYAEIQDSNILLQAQIDELQIENNELNKKVEELGKAFSIPSATVCDDSFLEKGLLLEKENLILLERIEKYQENEIHSMSTISAQARQIQVLTEQVDCLEENLQSKREELDEKTQLLECSQERMIEMNAELAALKSSPDNQNKKGNSLFAEVDDQRQAMKKLLAAQKKHYSQMKKIYDDSEHEIRRLKRENAAMYDELQLCSSMFLNADKTYKNKLTERIMQLMNQNEESEKKLSWTQKQLLAMADQKGINWLDSMFDYCKKETEELKEQLHSCRIQKNALEGILRNSQQDLAKWRFESLKSRCIIIERETLLEENNISFQSIKTSDLNITDESLKNAVPRISIQNRRKSQSLEKEVRRVSLELSTSLNAKNKNNANSLNKNNDINCTNLKIDSEDSNTKNTSKQELDTSIVIKPIQPNLHANTIQCKNRTDDGNTLFDIYEDKNSLRTAVNTQNINLDTTTKKMIEYEFPQVTKSAVSPCDTSNMKSICSNNLSNIKKELDSTIPFENNKYTENTCFDIYEDQTSEIPSNIVKIQTVDLDITPSINVENDLCSQKPMSMGSSLLESEEIFISTNKTTPKKAANQAFNIFEDTVDNIPLKLIKNSSEKYFENENEMISDCSFQECCSSQADNSFKFYENAACNVYENLNVDKVLRRADENYCLETNKCPKKVDLELPIPVDQENLNIVANRNTPSHVPQYRDIIFTEEDYNNLTLKLSFVDSPEIDQKLNIEYNESDVPQQSILRKTQNIINHFDSRKSVHFSESVGKSDQLQERKSIRNPMRKKANITVKRIVFPKRKINDII